MNGRNSEQTSDEVEESEEEPENVLNMQLNASDGLFTNKTYTSFFHTKIIFCLSLKFLNIMLEIRVRFS